MALDMVMNMELSEKLEMLRKQNGLTQKDVADILKINRTTYTKYETGVTEPNVTSLKKLAEIFGVDLNELLSDEDEGYSAFDSGSDEKRTRDMVKMFRLLSEKDKDTVLSQLKKRTGNSSKKDNSKK